MNKKNKDTRTESPFFSPGLRGCAATDARQKAASPRLSQPRRTPLQDTAEGDGEQSAGRRVSACVCGKNVKSGWIFFPLKKIK